MKRFFYASFFILLNIAYLIIELSFNAYLLDVSSSMSLVSDFTHLELYGRSISAAGATLLVWRLLIPFKEKPNLSRTLLKFLLITLIVFPTVFMGQKKLIDYLVDSSTAELRRSAEILSVLKYGIANGFVEIDELSIGELTLKTAEGKMFVVLAGLLIYSSEEELEKIDKQLKVISQYATTTQQVKDTQSIYRNYQYASLKIIEQYRLYSEVVSRYDQQQKAAHQKSVTLYEQAIADAMQRWSSFSIQRINLEYQYQLKQPSLSQLIKELSESVVICQNQTCVKQKSINSVAKINQLLGAQSNWQHWCDISQSIFSINCNSYKEVVDYKLQRMTEQYLIQQFGFEQYYVTKLEYLQSREFYDLFLLSLEKNHVPLLIELSLDQHEKILEEIKLHISMLEKQQYRQEIKVLMGETIRPRLSIGQFTLLPSMQRYYQKALDKMYSEALPINLTRDEFLKQIVEPIYVKRNDYLSNKLASNSSWYEQGAPYADSGKASLRNLVVPPVAIVMSLIFGVLNLISLLLNMFFLIIKENTIKRWFGFVLLITAFIITPYLNEYEISDQKAYENLLTHTQKDYEYSAYFAQWVIKVEPMIYSIGNILRINTLEGFEFD